MSASLKLVEQQTAHDAKGCEVHALKSVAGAAVSAAADEDVVSSLGALSWVVAAQPPIIRARAKATIELSTVDFMGVLLGDGDVIE
jgi:hypothetical protein